jgi:carbohydrate kinase (thermoresistant glucokinase family)
MRHNSLEEPMSDAVGSPLAVAVMGVSGSGKTTVAERIAVQLGAEMQEGDQLHPPENVAKMRSGVPLDDADRCPWLDAIGRRLQTAQAEGRAVVVTCSALKRAYRERLLAARPDLVFVYLKGSRALFEARVRGRVHEYMPASLLDSQFATLEEPGEGEPVIAVDAALPAEAEAQAAVAALTGWAPHTPATA